MTKARRNQKKARIYFGIFGNYDLVLHHKDTSLKYSNPERYNEWNVEDLVVMTRGEHTALHMTGNKNVEGQTRSEEAKKNMSEAQKASFLNGRLGSAVGKHWFNNGTTETYAVSCPNGFIEGRLKTTGKKISETKKLKRYAELIENYEK